jgi:hypothetical protein
MAWCMVCAGFSRASTGTGWCRSRGTTFSLQSLPMMSLLETKFSAQVSVGSNAHGCALGPQPARGLKGVRHGLTWLAALYNPVWKGCLSDSCRHFGRSCVKARQHPVYGLGGQPCSLLLHGCACPRQSSRLCTTACITSSPGCPPRMNSACTQGAGVAVTQLHLWTVVLSPYYVVPQSCRAIQQGNPSPYPMSPCRD